MILHIPHSSRTIPADLRKTLLLTDEELDRELLSVTDHWTDELFGGTALGSDTVIVYPVSRLIVDPERFEDDEHEPMATHGMGVIYQRTSTGRRLRASLSAQEREELISRFYRPHHKRLELAVEQELQQEGAALIIDCHSFPSRALPHEPEQDKLRPEICVGTDSYHTPEWLVSAIVRHFTALDYRVALNSPFSGSLAPPPWYHTDEAIWSVMIEIRRDLYMNELTGRANEYFTSLRGHLHSVTASARKMVRQMAPPNTASEAIVGDDQGLA